jgi:hypothetical protein
MMLTGYILIPKVPATLFFNPFCGEVRILGRGNEIAHDICSLPAPCSQACWITYNIVPNTATPVSHIGHQIYPPNNQSAESGGVLTLFCLCFIWASLPVTMQLLPGLRQCPVKHWKKFSRVCPGYLNAENTLDESIDSRVHRLLAKLCYYCFTYVKSSWGTSCDHTL